MLYYFSIIMFIYLIYNVFELHLILNTRYKNFQRINSLVSTQQKNKFKIIWFSLIIIFKALYMTLMQKIYKNVKKIDRNTYKISYCINGDIYHMVIKSRRGPKNVLQVIDENLEDVTHIITPYLGPNEDMHHFKFAPNFWNKKLLTFNLYNKEITFKENDEIVLV